jgi:hypothetical protein
MRLFQSLLIASFFVSAAVAQPGSSSVGFNSSTRVVVQTNLIQTFDQTFGNPSALGSTTNATLNPNLANYTWHPSNNCALAFSSPPTKDGSYFVNIYATNSITVTNASGTFDWQEGNGVLLEGWNRLSIHSERGTLVVEQNTGVIPNSLVSGFSGVEERVTEAENGITAVQEGKLDGFDLRTNTTPVLTDYWYAVTPGSPNTEKVFTGTQMAELFGGGTARWDFEYTGYSTNATAVPIYTNTASTDTTVYLRGHVIAAAPTNGGTFTLNAKLSNRGGTGTLKTNAVWIQEAIHDANTNVYPYWQLSGVSAVLYGVGVTNELFSWKAYGTAEAMINADATPSAENSLTNGLVVYYKLDETSDGVNPTTREDSIGSLDLTEVSGITEEASAKVSFGADFESGSTATLRNTSAEGTALDINGDNDWTIMCWIKPETVGATRHWVSKYSTTGANRQYAINTTSANDYRLTVSDDGITPVNIGTADISAASGVWRHLAWVRTASDDTIRMYVDGVITSEGAQAGPSTIVNGSENFNMGSQQNATNYADGVVDEVAIYNRTLNSGEVLTAYNRGIFGIALDEP